MFRKIWLKNTKKRKQKRVSNMQTLVTVIHVFTCILLVLVVLIQSGKGAEISTSFGGSSQTVFGSSGGANFFTRFTSSAAAVFMVTSLALTLMGGRSKKSLFESMATPTAAQSTAPVGGGAPAKQEAAPAAQSKAVDAGKPASAPQE
jgi:preprotein translocase subunit SecG